MKRRICEEAAAAVDGVELEKDPPLLDEVVAAVDGAEPKRDPPLLDESVAALDGAKPKRDHPLDEEAVTPLAGTKRLLLRGAVLCDADVLENTLDGVEAEEEAVAATDGVELKGRPPAKALKEILEDVVCGNAALENMLEGTTGGGIAEGA